jgi:predicted metal-dependent hydrolase
MEQAVRSGEAAYEIIPRQGLDFDLGGDIPKYWLGGDPFKTRFFDAMSCLFPEGEKFFIACVRDYKDQIKDPELIQQVKDFTRQEGQHGMVHTQFNNRLVAQGIEVNKILEKQVGIMFGFFRKRFSRAYTLGQTAAAEHMTAIMAHGFFRHMDLMAQADQRVRAMYAWHSVEEIEHKAVAYDVLTKVAKAGYFMRVLAFLQVAFTFPLHVFLIMNHMFRKDGFSFRQRAGLWLRGLWWLYQPTSKGLYAPIMGHFLAYLVPGFHPWKGGQMESYGIWRSTYDRTGDPIAAGDAMHLAAGGATA